MRPKFYSGQVLILGIVQLIEALAISIPLSYYPNYVIGLGASVASIGLFTSSFMVASAIMSPKMGSLSDTYGRKKIMTLGLLGDIIFGVLTGLAPSWPWLLLIRVINGAVSSATVLSAEALLIDSVSQFKRGEASGFINLMKRVGRNIGPIFGGVIQAFSFAQGLSILDSYRTPYFVDSAMAGLALLLVMWKVQDVRVVASSTPEQQSVASSSNRSIPLSSSFKVLLFCAFMNGIAVGFLVPIMVLFYTDKFGIEPVEIGLILSIAGVIGFAASWVAGRLSDKMGRLPLIAGGSILSRTSGFVVPLTGSVVQAASALSVRSLGFNISVPASRALRADLAPPEARGRFFGLYRTAFNIGDIIGPLIGTYLYEVYRFQQIELGGLTLPGYGIPFFVNSTLGLISTFLLLAFVKEPVRRK